MPAPHASVDTVRQSGCPMGDPKPKFRASGTATKDKTRTCKRSKDRPMKKLLSFLAVALVATSVFAGEFPDISVKEVKALTKSKKAVIIDVNGSDSYAKGHVPGALDYAAIKNEGFWFEDPGQGPWPLPPRGRHVLRTAGIAIP